MTLSLLPPPAPVMRDAVARALAEDLGRAGDITSQAVVPADAVMTAQLRARKPGRLAGLPLLVETYAQLDPRLVIIPHLGDGAALTPGEIIATLTGPARAILTGERTALNFLGHLSGIATETAKLVDAVAGTKARITCTRKTTPGLRALEKYAVRCGGARNHRFGLDDAVLIKDNHIAAAGGIRAALKAARTAVGHLVKIEVEIDRLDQLDDVLAEGADVILLDNMPPVQMARAVARIDGRALSEASGSVTLETVRAIAETGVDLISVGWITHSAPCLDLGLDVDG